MTAAGGSAPRYVTHAELLFNGELVKEVRHIDDDPNDGWIPGPPRILAIFDSTHFPNGTMVEVRARITNDIGQQTNKHLGTVPVRNSAMLFGRYEWEGPTSPTSTKGMPHVQQNFLNSNIAAPTYVNSSGWTGPNFESAVGGAHSILYINSHGEVEKQQYIPNPPINPPPWTYITSDLPVAGQPFVADTPNIMVATSDSGPPSYTGSYLIDVRASAIGGGQPPYNPTGKPPIAFAFNDTCVTGNDNAFAEAYLWPYVNGGGFSNQNQAFMGWGIYTSADQTSSVNSTLWSMLNQGYTVHQARNEVYNAYQGVNKPADPRDLLRVFGDFHTRIHGVYTGTGNDSPMTGWIR